MYRDAVEYRPGHWLAPRSKALELYKEKTWKELEALQQSQLKFGKPSTVKVMLNTHRPNFDRDAHAKNPSKP